MKLVESIEVVNGDRTWVGHKELKLTFDTETEYLEIDAPAMFVDPIVRFEDLQKVLNKFDVHQEKDRAQEDGAPQDHNR